MVDDEKYVKGPDQVITEATERFTTTIPDGAVKLRKTSADSFTEFPPMSVPTMLARTADLFGDKVAMAVKRDGGWKTYSYRQYYQDSRTAAKSFIGLGLQRFHSVCILGFNSPEWFEAQMGAIMAGGFSVGIYTTNSPEACRYVAENCRANVIVVEDKKQLDKIVQVRHQLPALRALVQYTGTPDVEGVLSWEQFMRIGRNDNDKLLNDRLKRMAVNQCCTLIYTSGTTGQPKGVMLSHDNLTWTARVTQKYLDVGHDDKFVSYLPLSHAAALNVDALVAATSGAAVYFADKDALKGSLATTLREVRPTVFLGVPRVFEKMAEKMKELGKAAPAMQRSLAAWAKSAGLYHNTKILSGRSAHGLSYPLAKKLVFSKIKKQLGLDKARLIGVGAAPLSRETFDFFLSLDVVLLECYGMSETSGPQTGNKPGWFKIGSVGPTLDGCITKILDPNDDGNGEVGMNSRNVMMGYLLEEAKTNEVIDEDGWLHSGDIGYIDDESQALTITGRLKELIITAGGENIPPVLIEDTIKAELDCISNAVLVGDQRKFLSCLLTLKVEVDSETMEPTDRLTQTALDWCRSVGVKATATVDDVLRNDAAMRAIHEGIERANQKAISNAQRVQKFVVVAKDFSIAGGELGPTMKVKRHHVLQQYSTQINNIYKT